MMFITKWTDIELDSLKDAVTNHGIVTEKETYVLFIINIGTITRTFPSFIRKLLRLQRSKKISLENIKREKRLSSDDISTSFFKNVLKTAKPDLDKLIEKNKKLNCSICYKLRNSGDLVKTDSIDKSYKILVCRSCSR